jgi:hypothetical protein
MAWARGVAGQAAEGRAPFRSRDMGVVMQANAARRVRGSAQPGASALCASRHACQDPDLACGRRKGTGDGAQAAECCRL